MRVDFGVEIIEKARNIEGKEPFFGQYRRGNIRTREKHESLNVYQSSFTMFANAGVCGEPQPGDLSCTLLICVVEGTWIYGAEGEFISWQSWTACQGRYQMF
jgi:hypothetical protein